MKRQKPKQDIRESLDLGYAIFSSLLFHVVLFFVLASTSIFYPAVGSAMRFDYIWLDPSLTPSATPSPLVTKKNVAPPSVAVGSESLNDAVEAALQPNSEIIPPQKQTMPVTPTEQPETATPDDNIEPDLELVRVNEAIKQPVPATVKPLPAQKQAPDLKADRERRVAEEARLKAAQAEAERLRLSVERARQEQLARERADRQRKEAEQLAALKAEQELRDAEETRIRAAHAEAEKLRELTEQAKQEQLAWERAELQRKADEQAAALKIAQERIAAEEAQLQAAQENAERLRQAAEHARQERMAREKAEQKRKEQAVRLKAAQEQKATEAQLKAKQEEAKRLRQAAEQARQDRLARQRSEELRNKAELAAKQKADKERQAAEEARQKSAQEEAERLRRVTERARQERLAREQSERQRKTAELAALAKAEQERRTADEARRSAEKERLAQEKPHLEKVAAMRKGAVTAPQQASGSPVERSQDAPVTPTATASVEKKPTSPKPEKKGIIIPAVHGDLKLVVSGKSPLKIATTFRAYQKSRRNRPQTLNEARQEKNITPLIVTQADDTKEAIIEKAQEGIYTFIAEPAEGTTPRSGFTLKIFESTNKARTRSIGDKTVSGKTVVTKVLMPDGILWDDESAFTGSIEDSNSITKFNAETGLIWKEFSN
ncbi:hypothetical protein [Geobacter sp. AOG1]|uniref:hypothetical protein n=1 Tax=Geobacter sp. AOG1 TaxID=1566346 RepID=UPI001CC50B76|nr:hypothetical protein [Geobacter sp. AOG1]GFE58400.1 hypothetical protein AOG1_22800 [Geobacter sp. AOG1]